MPFFPRSMFTSDLPRCSTGEFTPLFRLLDDYASHQLSRTGEESTTLSSFRPKFDIKENKETYELHGELPGIDQKDVQIEFSDASTLVVKGRTERHVESGTPPTGYLENAPEQAKIAETSSEHEHEHYHKPTVEDEQPTIASGGSGDVTPVSDNAVATTNAQAQQQQPKSHYWLSERSVGEFHRAFSFPTRIDQDNVKASLKNGILSIVVPKSQAPTTRRIDIE